jgi:hypothetical protein
MLVTKTPSAAVVNVGSQVSYAYSITNVGVMTLTGVTAVDDKVGTLKLGEVSDTTSLAPGASVEVFKSDTVEREDLPGPLTNVVTVTGVTPLGESLTVTKSASVTLTDGSLLFTKSVGIDGIQPACSGQIDRKVPLSTTVVYCYSIQNVGVQTFTHHSLLDSDLGVLLDNEAHVVPPGGVYSITVTKTVTVDVTNVATWTAAVEVDGAALPGVASTLDGMESQVAAIVRISGPNDDQDVDTIPDNVEGAADVDGDNEPNFLDADSDGDGLLDRDEVGPDPANPRDSNGDGIPDYLSPLQRLFMPRLGRQ